MTKAEQEMIEDKAKRKKTMRELAIEVVFSDDPDPGEMPLLLSKELREIVGMHSKLWNYPKVETVKKFQTLIDQEVKKARIDELNELNYQIAKNSWHKENAYKMYPYILDRIAELEKDNK